MRRALPISLLFFVATGIVFLLQKSPATGIFMMLMLAMFWSVILINAGLIGIAIEALTGRVYRAWILLPLIVYVTNFGFAAYDHFTLKTLRAAYDIANAQVHVPFNSNRQALVFDKDGSPEWYTQNYALEAAYLANEKQPEEVRSTRLIDRALCDAVRGNSSLSAARIYTFGFHDGEALGGTGFERRFCTISMPEAPKMPVIRIKVEKSHSKVAFLPIQNATTTIETPDGKRVKLRGGTASPLYWIPMPVMGCALNSGAPSWDCVWVLLRDDFTPIVSGSTRYRRDLFTLARALGLRPVAKSERKAGSPPAVILARMEKIESETLQRQLANLDAMIADPLLDNPDWDVGVLARDSGILSQKSTMIMIGVEKSAAITGTHRGKARESGRILAGLLARLPDEIFRQLKPRILGVYKKADDEHWLWEAETLIRRLGDLGVEAMPFLINPRASGGNVNNAGIEAICRVGVAGRELAMPALLSMWNASRDRFDWDRRQALFVAMQRLNIEPPPLTQVKGNQLSNPRRTSSDISPQSPASVCSTR